MDKFSHLRGDQTPQAERPLTLTLTQFILFFDGGSRGDPGPDGAGAVIAADSSDGVAAHIVWSATMSLKAPTTTNNQAEYMGLITGLTAALHHQWRPLVFLLASTGSVPPAQEPHAVHSVIQSLYAKARRLADTLRVGGWRHHVRAYNRAADAVANLAMDTAASSQVLHPTARDGHARLQSLLHSDFAHWQESHFAA